MIADINKSIKAIGVILFAGFIIGYIVPFSICYNTGGLTNREVLHKVRQARIKNGNTESVSRYYFAQVRNRAIDSQITALEQSNTDLAGNEKDTIQKLEAKKIDLKKIARVRVSGFLDSKLSLIWPISLTALLIIYFIILPIRTKIDWKHFFMIFIPIGIIFIFPTILRSTGAGQDGRMIYSVYNIEINPAMYYYNLFLNIFLIAFVVLTWLKCDVYVKNNIKNHFSEFSLKGIISTFTVMKRNYSIWQFYSVALFAVFGAMLYNLYSDIFVDGDKRFLFQAIFFNFIYLFTWVLGTIPLYFEFEIWRSFKDRVLFDKATEATMTANGINVEELRKIIPDYEIASSLNHTVTVVFSAVSFLLPLIRALIH